MRVSASTMTASGTTRRCFAAGRWRARSARASPYAVAESLSADGYSKRVAGEGTVRASTRTTSTVAPVVVCSDPAAFEPEAGLEPATPCLQDRCSAN
jgi:hypothetical protein